MTPWIATALALSATAEPSELFVHIRDASGKIALSMPYSWLEDSDMLEPELARRIERMPLDRHATALQSAPSGTRHELRRGLGPRRLVVSLECRPTPKRSWLGVDTPSF